MINKIEPYKSGEHFFKSNNKFYYHAERAISTDITTYLAVKNFTTTADMWTLSPTSLYYRWIFTFTEDMFEELTPSVSPSSASTNLIVGLKIATGTTVVLNGYIYPTINVGGYTRVSTGTPNNPPTITFNRQLASFGSCNLKIPFTKSGNDVVLGSSTQQITVSRNKPLTLTASRTNWRASEVLNIAYEPETFSGNIIFE